VKNADVLSQVKAHIESAAALLRSLGSDYEKTAWMVEDTANYLTEKYEGRVNFGDEGAAQPIRWEDHIDEPLAVVGSRR